MFTTRYRHWVNAACSLTLASAALGADIDTPKPMADGGTNAFHPLVKADRLTVPDASAASREGEARIKQFRVPPGAKVELFASEPMLANPVAFSVDEKGRVWTSETYRYRSSVLDIRYYMHMLEDDLDNRTIEDRLAQIRRQFGPEGEKQLSKESEILRLLEDTDGDGKADKSTIVLDGLNSPMDGIASGVLARNGRVWFTDIPSVWKIAPADSKNPPIKALPTPADPALVSHPKTHLGNYQATELLRGFGIRFSFTGHDLHGLKFGPDGRLYFSCGDRGTHVVNREGKVVTAEDEGGVFRCEPDGSKFELYSRGLRNPQELAFDEYGNLFTGDNDSDQGDRERWVYVVEGADSGWRVGYQHAPLGNAGPWNMERLWVPHFEGQAAYIMPPLANIGDGPSGLVYNYGTGLPPGLDQRYFLAYFKGTSAKSGVYSLATRPKGAGFELRAHDEFVWNALVPDVDIGPDGAVWFADWHEGWPKSSKGRLYRLSFAETAAAAAKETAALLAAGFSNRTESELLGYLTHHDMRIRQEAQFELAARGNKSLASLTQTALTAPSQFARIHAIWGLGQLGRAATGTESDRIFQTLVPILNDPDAEIRAQAAKTLGDSHWSGAPDRLAEHISDAAPRAAYFSLMSYTKTGAASGHRATSDKVARGIEIAAASSDIWLQHAAAFALTDLLSSDPGHLPRTVRNLEKNPNPTVRKTVVVAMRRAGDGAAADFLKDADPLVVLEAARAINDVPILKAQPALAALGNSQNIDDLLRKFGTAPTAYPTPESIPRPAGSSIRDVRADQPLPWTNAPVDQLSPMMLRVVNANYRLGTAEAATRLAALAKRDDLTEIVRGEALKDLAAWGTATPRDRVVGISRPLPAHDAAVARRALQPVVADLLAKGPQTVQVAVAQATAQLGIIQAVDALTSLLKNSGAAEGARAAALRALAALKIADINTLLKYAAADTHEALRLEASRLNAELNPADAAGQLRARVETGSLNEQQGALASLATLKSDAADAIIADALDKLMSRSMSDDLRLDVVEAARKRKASAVQDRLKKYEDWRLPQDHLTPFREALTGGDAERGRKIFYENASVGCVRCHHIGNDGGGNAGPELTGIGTRQQREYLLESIVLPNKQIAPGFETSVITVKGGTLYSGIVKSENDSEVVLLSPEEGEVRLRKSDIKERAKGVSGMPEGFADLVSRFDLRDLVEFLATRK